MKKIRWGIISTAEIAQAALIPAMQRASNAEVTAIASGSGKAKEVAEKHAIAKAYESYEALLQDPEIDAVYIPLPNHLHKQWVIEAARHGKHVLCEKPAALSAEETRDMITACEKHKVIFMEAFMYQFHPQHQRVRELLAAGEIGQVGFMRSSFSFLLEQPEGNIRMNPETGGGSIYDIGCYSIHSIRHVLGTEPVEVDVYAEIDPAFQVDTAAYARMKLANGVTAVFDTSFGLAFRHEYEIAGSKGRIIVPRAYRPDLHQGEGLIIIEKDGKSRTETIVGDQYRLEVEHISQAILEQRQPDYSGEQSWQNMRVIDACYESVKTGQTVKVT